MKSKNIILIAVILVVAILAMCLVACGEEEEVTSDPNLLTFEGITFENKTVSYTGNEQSITAVGVPEGATVSYTNNKGTNPGDYNAKAVIRKPGYNDLTLNAKLTIQMPTAEQVVEARQRYLEDESIGYNFRLNLNGKVSIAGYNGEANANYEGAYRFDKESGEVQFKRTTSGVLLYDSTEYIYTEGTTKVKVVVSDKGEIKRISAVPSDQEELILLNLPFESLVNALDADNLTNISMVNDAKYKFKATIMPATQNSILTKILNAVANMGTKLKIKDVSFTNPIGGISIYFNLDSSMTLEDYRISAEIAFPVKGVKVAFALSYEQTGNHSGISIPAMSGLVTNESAIKSELNTIKNAINAVKSSDTYSLDLVAENQFDPSWNVTATTDKYISRMYKNTYDLDGGSFVAFNNSFEYKTHHEEDGSETYKYTIGNVTSDGSVWEILRKGKNEQNQLNGVSVNTQFNYMTAVFLLDSSDVDCIMKETKNGSTFYYVHLNEKEAVNVQEKINAFINSNNAEGVIKVDNYFDEENHTIMDAVMVVEIKNGKVVEISTETKITYTPTAGEYTDRNITLTDTLTLVVDENYDKASEYTAPKNVTTSITGVGLNNVKYYIQ